MDTKYLENGYEVEVLASGDFGFLVRYLYDEEDAISETDTHVVSRVYDEPPTPRIAKVHTELQQAVDALRAERNELQQQIAEARRNEGARINKLKQHKSLQLLEDFLDGKITHYAEWTSYSAPRIIELASKDAKCNCSYYCKDLRLLSLFGKSNGDLEWQLSHYSDGSGSYGATVIPCTSREQALSAIRDYITDLAAKTKDKPEIRVIEYAATYGVELPAEYHADVMKNKVAVLRENIQKKRDNLQYDEAQLAQLQQQGAVTE